jgi:hypothetical protein
VRISFQGEEELKSVLRALLESLEGSSLDPGRRSSS